MTTPTILIPGGYGVFGSLLARELLRTTEAHLLLAGRDGKRAEQSCVALGGERVEPVQLDLCRPGALRRAARGCFAAACAAGPFSNLPEDLPLQAIHAGAHWLDISDSADWVMRLLNDNALARKAADCGVGVMPGLSTTPALSGVLARRCKMELPDASCARITLFIGNQNRKGAGAISSALQSSFDRPTEVDLPVGRRSAYRFSSPDTLLLQEDPGLDAEFRTVLEWPLANRLMSLVAPLSHRLPTSVGAHLSHHLSTLARPFSHFGSETGCLQVELWNPADQPVAAAFVGAGQQMAILPLALALEAMLAGNFHPSGVHHPATWLPPEEWIERLRERGLAFYFSDP